MLVERGKQIELALWSELIGRFVRLEVSESEVSVVLACGAEHVVLFFPKNSPESEILQTGLSSVRPGARVGLLRADKAFFVRTIRAAEDCTHERK
ncbi:MAG: hypothetical protein QMD23_02585 [Candidatus Bathyarchaeia archaeon]|nr:hypothetical protein [Candidatus Bathyarchaeia archaeon]